MVSRAVLTAMSAVLFGGAQAINTTGWGYTYYGHYSDYHPNTTGTFLTHENFPSAYVIPRDVLVWLPEGYEDDDVDYSVLYMQDGQNLFELDSQAIASATWDAHSQLSMLLNQGIVHKTIVVGVSSTALRDREYMPSEVYERLDNISKEALVENCHGTPLSEAYVRFFAEELKPFIDKTYRTKSHREHTFVAGSSLGGLISLDLLLQYPHVFSAAACLSPHWPLTDDTWFLNSSKWVQDVTGAWTSYLKKKLPAPGVHRFWFDHGDQGLDAWYGPYQDAVDAVMETEGYMKGQDWITKTFSGGDHNEISWQARFQQGGSFTMSTHKNKTDFHYYDEIQGQGHSNGSRRLRGTASN